ncbi:hypothetical protein RJJ65_30600 [Rhizobium hidalgonense]|uniref:Uncharacterized protein n=1 Tax=Rhizobium hidalgonense TaxID=1538159 RepID=A0AAJ2LMS7_9HYPH|nr:hypothetical protein [Rhizobium hidalgonense]MDR9776927.1 hypothetical protein [Rhizobium hidalgonense]MDR9814020.1 hypothetical protein [Rhizobium hidalgonense]MDR9820660.1 hypothetical protein [Rhizobium hidalgonense]
MREFDHVSVCPHDWALLANSDVIGPRQVRLALVIKYAEVEGLHHLAVLGVADVLLTIIAYGFDAPM